jgi:hypothetical protein
MNSTSKFTSWIDLNNPQMCTWISNDLDKRKGLPEYGDSRAFRERNSGYHISDFINQIVDTATDRELISKMRKSWNQGELRNSYPKKGKKQYTFVLSNDAHKQLVIISKRERKPQNKTLELLIFQHYEYYAEAKSELKNINKMIKQQKQKLKEVDDALRSHTAISNLKPINR